MLFGLDRFGYKSVRIISGLHRVSKNSGQFRFDSGHIRFRVNSGHYSFGSVRFWVGSISDFGSKSVQLFLMSVWVWFRVVRFGSFGSGHFCQISLSNPPFWGGGVALAPCVNVLFIARSIVGVPCNFGVLMCCRL